MEPEVLLPPLAFILSQMDQGHIVTPNFFKMNEYLRIYT
jgi:hypothetical protein